MPVHGKTATGGDAGRRPMRAEVCASERAHSRPVHTRPDQTYNPMEGGTVRCIVVRTVRAGLSWPVRSTTSTGKSLSEALFFCRTWGEHVVYKNSSECRKQFLYTTCSPQV